MQAAGLVADLNKLNVAICSSELNRPRGVYLACGVERRLGLHRDTDLGHYQPKPISAEGVERILALPCVDVVAVVSLPPRDVRVAAVWWALEPADLGSDAVILLR